MPPLPYHESHFLNFFIVERIIMFKKILCLALVAILLTGTVCFAAGDTKLVKKINTALVSIKNWIIQLATPAAAVSVGTGILMKKFSFGDEERIIKRKKTH